MNKIKETLTTILYISDQHQNLEKTIQELREATARVILICPKSLSVPVYPDVSTITYDDEGIKTDLLNLAVSLVESPWIMLLEGDEHLNTKHLDYIPLNKGEAYAFMVECDYEEHEAPKKYYQIRIFEKVADTPFFKGELIPDMSASFEKLGWKLGEESLPLQKFSNLFPIERVEEEIERGIDTRLCRFWAATLAGSKGQYLKAEQILRKLVRTENPITFEQVAALNGLADALMEQHKWAEAEVVALRSLDYARLQRAPYLILFKVNYVNGNWDKAYTALEGYLTTLGYASRATMDVVLPVVECHFLMGEVSHRKGDYSKAFKHYEHFYKLNNGNVASSVAERLFIYSIELEDFDKAVDYFNNMFGEYLEAEKVNEVPVKMFESLSLFNQKGWFDFVSTVYEQLRSYDPENKRLLHGWVATLVKANKLEQAQELIGFMKKKKKPA
jgi:tetratricopeptide (TPR) repeat protein